MEIFCAAVCVDVCLWVYVVEGAADVGCGRSIHLCVKL